jgi:hypothetical protein
MSGCSLHEAFPDTATQSGKKAKKWERDKAKRCQSPALAFLKATDDLGDQGPDPDRLVTRLPPSDKLQGQEGFVTQAMIKGISSPTAGNQEDYMRASDDYSTKIMPDDGQAVDVIGGKTPPAAATKASQLPDTRRSQDGTPVPSYFGKSAKSADGFADFSKSLADNTGYQVAGADFLGSFAQSGANKASGVQSLPIPTINNNWKPLTPSGANTSFFESHHDVVYGQQQMAESSFSKDEKESLLKKLDHLFARLEELEAKKNEYAHAEVSIFILSGLFLLFGLESVRKFR